MRNWLSQLFNKNHGKIFLVEDYFVIAEEINDYVASVAYKICLGSKRVVVGRCDLRIGMNEELYYAGNIGYSIKKKYRGNGYAYDAAKLLLGIAKGNYMMEEVLITCDPDNVASRKTCERLNGKLEAIVDVPESHWLIKQKEYKKCIFRYSLKGEQDEKNFKCIN
ncbi:MAG: GNAT family N-acetyltransferase [Anaerorhabdus sp.]